MNLRAVYYILRCVFYNLKTLTGLWIGALSSVLRLHISLRRPGSAFLKIGRIREKNAYTIKNDIFFIRLICKVRRDFFLIKQFDTSKENNNFKDLRAGFCWI